MKKKMMSILLATAVCASLLGGCGGQSSDDSAKTMTTETDDKAEEKTPDTTSSDTASSDGAITVGMCAKLMNDGHMLAIGEGAQVAADEFGYTLDFNGPVQGDITEQTDIINQWTQKGYDAITISANDADALTPAMEAAAKAGILTSSWDADINPEARKCMVTQATEEGVGIKLGEEIVRSGVTSGNVLVITSTLTAPNQSAWLEHCRTWLAENAPDVTLVDVLPCNEDTSEARDLTYNYLMAHKDTVAVLGMCATGLAGACEAIDQLSLSGQVKATGIFVPSLNADYLKSGTCFSGVLWDPYELGYCTIAMVKAQIDGKIDEVLESGELDCGKYGKKEVIDKEKGIICLGEPMVFTTDNVDDYDF